MQSPTEKRVSGVIRRPGQRVKRQATTPTRMTRSMLKKLNEYGGSPVELDPGLDMGVRRRGPRTERPSKRPAPDESIAGSVKQGITKKRRGAQSKAKESKFEEVQPVKSNVGESRPKEQQTTGPKLAESEPTESQSAEPQKAEPKSVTAQPTTPEIVAPGPLTPKPMTPEHITPQPATPVPRRSETRFSKADVAAAAQLAQAAIAAGLTGTISEAGSPVIEDRPSLVHFTRRDLKDLLSEAVAEEEIRQRMEPHWLARTEFLTWWERPAADIDHIKDQVRRLAVRWSKDLQAQNPDDVEIPISMLESWRADLVIVGDPKQGNDDNEAENEGGEATEDGNADDDGQRAEEGKKKEAEIEGEGGQKVKEQQDDRVVEAGGADLSPGLVKLLAEKMYMAMRDMAEWKEAFDNQIAGEPEFRRGRAWAAIILESQKEATALEGAVQDLGTRKCGLTTSSARKDAQTLLIELQHFRNKLQMDRAAFRDEFDEEGAETLLEKTRSSGKVEEQAQEDTRRDDMSDFAAELEAKLEAEPEDELEDDFAAELENELVQDFDGETESEPEGYDVQMAEIQARKEGTRMKDTKDRHDLNSGHGCLSESEPGPAESLSEVKNNDSEPKPIPAGLEHKSEGKPAEGPIPSEQHDGSVPIMKESVVGSKYRVLEGRQRGKAESTARGSSIGLLTVEEEAKSETLPMAKLENQDQGGAAVEAEGEMNQSRPTPRMPEESNNQIPSQQRSGQEEKASEVTSPEATAAVEEQENPFREARINMAADLYRYASIEEASNEDENITNQGLTSSDITGLLTPETKSVALSTRSASPEITTGAVENKEDGSSTASNISSLPEDPSSPRSARPETAEELRVGDVVDAAPQTDDVITVPESTSLPQSEKSSVAVVTTESNKEVGGSLGDTEEDISPSTHIKRILEEASMPRDIGASIGSTPPRNVEETRGGSAGAVNHAPTPEVPQDTGLKSLCIPLGSGVELGIRVEEAVQEGTATSDDAALPQRSSIGGDMDSPPAMSAEENPSILPTLRYIKPQWEDTGSLFSPEEPTYVYSANEADDDDDENAAVDSVDDRETDDVDP